MDTGDMGRGGALVWIDARRLTLSGVIRSNGGDAGAYFYSTAGSGGGIWIECGRFEPLAGATMEAKGGNVNGESGAGGGGRIQVWYVRRMDNTAVDYIVTPGTYTQAGAFAEPGTWFEGDLPQNGTTIIIR